MYLKILVFIFMLIFSPFAQAGEAVRFSAGDRLFLQDFMSQEYKSRCPGKMAKLRKGCRLPDNRNLYKIGEPIPDTTMTFPLPDFLQEKIDTVPPGYIHLQTGKDIILLRSEDKIVLDAVTLRDSLGEPHHD